MGRARLKLENISQCWIKYLFQIALKKSKLLSQNSKLLLTYMDYLINFLFYTYYYDYSELLSEFALLVWTSSAFWRWRTTRAQSSPSTTTATVSTWWQDLSSQNLDDQDRQNERAFIFSDMMWLNLVIAYIDLVSPFF